MRPRARALLAALALAAAIGCARQRSAPAPEAARPGGDGARLASATIDDVRARIAAPGARATMVHVWATWCAPCREEFPMLLRLVRTHDGDGLRTVLVSADVDSAAASAFLAEHGVDFPSWLQSGDPMAFIDGLDRRWSGALPATFVYGADGRLLAFWEGAADSTRFEAAVRTALDAAPGPS